MKIGITRNSTLSSSDLHIVLNWWNEEFPFEFEKSQSQFDQWLKGLGSPVHYRLFDKGVFSAWAMTFDRDDERWFSILVPHCNHGKGYGQSLIRQLQADESSLCGWVITERGLRTRDGRMYSSPMNFYKKLNFRQTQVSTVFTPEIHPVKIIFP